MASTAAGRPRAEAGLAQATAGRSHVKRADVVKHSTAAPTSQATTKASWTQSCGGPNATAGQVTSPEAGLGSSGAGHSRLVTSEDRSRCGRTQHRRRQR
ncbi:unnamed protein product [Lampetra planeri]